MSNLSLQEQKKAHNWKDSLLTYFHPSTDSQILQQTSAIVCMPVIR